MSSRSGGNKGVQQRRPPWVRALACLSVLLIINACAGTRLPEEGPADTGRLAPLGYTIQAGAFTVVENAARLTDSINRYDLEAYYFVSSDGLYRVRFGNFTSREQAEEKARDLVEKGIIEEFYIVSPEEYPAAPQRKAGEGRLREGIIETARGYLGVPYRWGGTDVDEGFDCSGLVMAVYRLNGLNLPRTSREQFNAGRLVKLRRVREGDLVFFRTSRGARVSHVGIYMGEGRFIHAPGRGGAVRIDSLQEGYYEDRYVGARSYL